MRKGINYLLIALLALPLWIAGCAPRVGGSDYDASSTRGAQSVNYGTVESVRTVHITDDNQGTTVVSTVGGAVAGGVLGSLIGGGSGRTAATVGGALLGAGAGYGGSKLATGQTGYEIMVRLDNGELLAVTQGADITFRTGQRVRVLSGGGTTRVVPEQ